MDSWSFVVAMKRKLRLELWPPTLRSKMHVWMYRQKDRDYIFSYQSFNKTTMSNAIPNGRCKAMKRICVTAQYCNSSDAVDAEKRGVVNCSVVISVQRLLCCVT
jgi:predicted nucleic acid-binding Zn finger protein